MVGLGQEARLFEVNGNIESLFPRLLDDGYTVTSPATPEYNCIAWAAMDATLWWEPDPYYLYYWPSGAPRSYTLEAYKKAYEFLGYIICDNAEYEDGYEKIAIYVDDSGKPTHAARQLSSGRWTSKLGQSVDIEHNTLEGLNGNGYGSVFSVMRRSVT